MLRIRDRESFLLFVIGTSLSFFIVINGYNLLNAWFNQMLKKQDESSYRYYVLMEIQRELPETRNDVDNQEDYLIQLKVAEDVLAILEKQEYTTYINDIYLPVGAASEEQPVNVIIAGKEEWYRSLESGYYPAYSEWKNHGRMAVVNETAMKFVEVIDGQKVIKINGENYLVVGVYNDYQISNTSVEIGIYYVPGLEEDIVQQKLAEAFVHGFGRNICIGSNQEDVAEAAKSLQAELELITGYKVEISDYDLSIGNVMIEAFYAKIRGIVLGILFLVSLINCQQIAKLWITRKKKELVILKTFGMNDFQIVKRLLWELIKMCLSSMAVVVVLNMAYKGFIIKDHVALEIELKNSILLLMAFLIVIGFAILPVIQSVRKVLPAQGLRGER